MSLLRAGLTNKHVRTQNVPGVMLREQRNLRHSSFIKSQPIEAQPMPESEILLDFFGHRLRAIQDEQRSLRSEQHSMRAEITSLRHDIDQVNQRLEVIGDRVIELANNVLKMDGKIDIIVTLLKKEE
jgi:peptidoglycan hydrolase CwlO-like protein